MNVYDWDKTIYKNDSTVDFYFWELKRDLTLLRYAPVQIWGFLGRFLGLHDKTVMKSYFYRYLAGIKDTASDVEEFWNEHISNVNKWYLEKHHEDDLVISASADFLVRPACRRLGITKLIASEVNPVTGEVLSKNCHGIEKVVRFDEAGYKREDVEEFYSDSLGDTPMADISKKAFLVKGEKVVSWPI